MNLARSLLAVTAFCWSTAALGQMTDPGLPSQAALEAALAEAIRASCPQLRYSVDPALSLAAAGFARAVEEGRAAPAGSALAFFASLESAEPAPTAGVASIEPAARADRAVGDLFSRTCRFNRVGLAAARYKAGAVVGLLTARHETELGALPGRAEAGDRLVVRGRLPRGLKSPRLFVLKPGGNVDQRDLARANDGSFSAGVALEQRGETVIELLAEGDGGPRVLALRRVFVGVEPPLSPPADVNAAKDGQGLDAVAAAISALRAARGLPPLLPDAALDEVARGHSAAMARSRTFAHVLQSDGGLTDRLYKAGYGYRFAGENIGLAATAALAHEAVALSPAHLANLLDPRHRRVGLGAVGGKSPEGSPAIYLTEVLAAPIVGLSDPAAAVLEVLVRERERQELPPLERDQRLDKVAEREVRAAALAGGKPAVGDAANRALAAAPGLTSAAADLYVGTEPEDVLRSKNLASAGWTHVGVGALYASSPTLGPGRLWVMLVFAR